LKKNLSYKIIQEFVIDHINLSF